MKKQTETRTAIDTGDIDRNAINPNPDIERVGEMALDALAFLEAEGYDYKYDAVRDLIIEIQREIFPKLWQPVTP